jgi:hypothetical protein
LAQASKDSLHKFRGYFQLLYCCCLPFLLSPANRPFADRLDWRWGELHPCGLRSAHPMEKRIRIQYKKGDLSLGSEIGVLIIQGRGFVARVRSRSSALPFWIVSPPFLKPSVPTLQRFSRQSVAAACNVPAPDVVIPSVARPLITRQITALEREEKSPLLVR